jgi:hypothetical protein
MVRNSILKKIVPFDGKIFYRNPSGLKKSFFVFFFFFGGFFGKIGLGLLEKFRFGDNKFLYNFCSLRGGFSLDGKIHRLQQK